MASENPMPQNKLGMKIWKRILLIGMSITIGIIVAGGTIVSGFYWYYNHPRPAKKWDTLLVESNQVEIKLRTKWRDDNLTYQLHISPAPPKTAEDFETAVKSLQSSTDVTVVLKDSAGFKVCTISTGPSQFVSDMNAKGTIASLSIEDTAYSCSLGHYKEATNWTVTWRNLPDLSAKMPPRTDAATSKSPKRTPRDDQNISVDETDSLSGVDFLNGKLDTKAGLSLSVIGSGEQYTVAAWHAGETIHITCKSARPCVVENTDRNETVHARLVK